MKIIYTLIALCFSVLLNAQKAGTLDSSFGLNGKVLDNEITGEIHKLALQSDGKIVGCGEASNNDTAYFQLMRYRRNGDRDTSFGIDGLSAKVDYTVADLAIQTDDKIVTVGNTNVAVKISRYTKEGKPDVTFGDRGTVTTDFSKHEVAAAVLIQSDGKIIAGGYIRNAPNEANQGFLVRCLTDGTLDKSFGNGGIVIFNTPDHNVSISIVTSIALANNGKIAVGVIYLGGVRGVVYCFKSNGSLDSSFNEDGRAYFQSEDDSIRKFEVYDLAFQTDGKIVGCGPGLLKNGSNSRMVVSRLKANGDTDMVFGIRGITHVTIGNASSSCNSILIQPDNKIIVSGTTRNNQLSDFAVARFKTNGTPDSTFGEAGFQATSIGKDDYEGSSVLQPDGKIIVAGGSDSAQFHPYYISLVRYFAKVIKGHPIYDPNTGDAQATTLNTISIYPNPAQNILHVEGLSSQNAKLTVVDFNGNIKLQAVANASSYNLNIASLHAGNYLLKIETNGAIVTKQFVKE